MGNAQKLYRIQLLIILYLFLNITGYLFLYSYLFYNVLLFSTILTVLFIAYSIIYVLKNEGASSIFKGYGLLLNSIFIIFIVLFVLMLTSKYVSLAMLVYVLGTFEKTGLYFLLYLPVFFLFFFGAYLFKSGKKTKAYRNVGIVLILMGAAVLFFYYFSPYIFQYYRYDDEVYIAFMSVKFMASGINPYNTSVAQQLFYNASTIGPSLTTNNQIVGVMDYPSLYFLSFVPFYFLSQPNLYDLGHIDLKVQAYVLLLALLLTIAYVMKKKRLMKPQYAIMLFLAFEIRSVASIQTYLMLALVILAYVKIDKKYSWLLLGLCVSIQEQLWLPVLFLVMYSFNNYGFKKGIKDIAGIALVFLVFNGYFIAIGPHTYVNAVFSPLNKFYFPNGSATIGFYLLTQYHMLIGTYTTFFIGCALILGLILLYTNRKELIPLFSMIPFLLLSHSLAAYYIFFTFFFVLAIYIEEKRKGKGRITEMLRRHRQLFYALVLVCIAFILLIAYESHVQYQNNFNVSIQNQSFYFNNTDQIGYYSGELEYSNVSNDTVYLVLVSYSNYSIELQGLLNQSIINNSQSCIGANYTCLLNVNKITLNDTKGTYMINAHISFNITNDTQGQREVIQNGTGFGNSTRSIIYLSPVLYNGEYFYVGKSLFNFTEMRSNQT